MPVATRGQGLRAVLKGRMEVHCPACGSVIYSRRAKLCGVCSAPLPEELRITGKQAEKISSLVKQMEKNIRRMEEEERQDELRHRSGGFF